MNRINGVWLVVIVRRCVMWVQSRCFKTNKQGLRRYEKQTITRTKNGLNCPNLLGLNQDHESRLYQDTNYLNSSFFPAFLSLTWAVNIRLFAFSFDGRLKLLTVVFSKGYVGICTTRRSVRVRSVFPAAPLRQVWMENVPRAANFFFALLRHERLWLWSRSVGKKKTVLTGCVHKEPFSLYIDVNKWTALQRFPII